MGKKNKKDETAFVVEEDTRAAKKKKGKKGATPEPSPTPAPDDYFNMARIAPEPAPAAEEQKGKKGKKKKNKRGEEAPTDFFADFSEPTPTAPVSLDAESAEVTPTADNAFVRTSDAKPVRYSKANRQTFGFFACLAIAGLLMVISVLIDVGNIPSYLMSKFDKMYVLGGVAGILVVFAIWTLIRLKAKKICAVDGFLKVSWIYGILLAVQGYGTYVGGGDKKLVLIEWAAAAVFIVVGFVFRLVRAKNFDGTTYNAAKCRAKLGFFKYFGAVRKKYSMLLLFITALGVTAAVYLSDRCQLSLMVKDALASLQSGSIEIAGLIAPVAVVALVLGAVLSLLVKLVAKRPNALDMFALSLDIGAIFSAVLLVLDKLTSAEKIYYVAAVGGLGVVLTLVGALVSRAPGEKEPAAEAAAATHEATDVEPFSFTEATDSTDVVADVTADSANEEPIDIQPEPIAIDAIDPTPATTPAPVQTAYTAPAPQYAGPAVVAQQYGTVPVMPYQPQIAPVAVDTTELRQQVHQLETIIARVGNNSGVSREEVDKLNLKCDVIESKMDVIIAAMCSKN